MLPSVQSSPPIESLPALVERAALHLASAKDSAEVLDARDMATVAYTAAKAASRLAKAKSAHSDLCAKARHAMADALEIEALANRRIADEYDAAQERGEVQPHGGQGKRDIPNENIPSVSDIGLTAKEVHEAREIRDAEEANPGIVRRTLDDALEAGEEPTKAAVRRAVRRRPQPEPSLAGKQLANLRKAWREACPAVRQHFLTEVTDDKSISLGE
jgi:hypothetical protein